MEKEEQASQRWSVSIFAEIKKFAQQWENSIEERRKNIKSCCCCLLASIVNLCVVAFQFSIPFFKLRFSGSFRSSSFEHCSRYSLRVDLITQPKSGISWMSVAELFAFARWSVRMENCRLFCVFFAPFIFILCSFEMPIIRNGIENHRWKRVKMCNIKKATTIYCRLTSKRDAEGRRIIGCECARQKLRKYNWTWLFFSQSTRYFFFSKLLLYLYRIMILIMILLLFDACSQSVADFWLDWRSSFEGEKWKCRSSSKFSKSKKEPRLGRKDHSLATYKTT